MAVNYNDPRLTQVEDEREEALSENDKLYDGMIEKSGEFYDQQIAETERWGQEQAQLQQEQTDFAIEKIEQQKEQAREDYIKEQSGSYADWQKQSNQYGVNAEQMASQGLTNTGYSESSQVSMYNTYQNRVAIARETFGKAVLEYDNMIKDAQLQNNSILAEIAHNTLQEKAVLALQGFQYENELIDKKVTQSNIINNRYDAKWQGVLDQINTENALEEEIRQYNLSRDEEIRQFDLSLEETKRQFNVENAGNEGNVKGGGGITDGNLTRTGFTLGTVLGNNPEIQDKLTQMGFGSNDEVLYMDGKYYVRKGENYVDMTQYIKPIIKNMPLN